MNAFAIAPLDDITRDSSMALPWCASTQPGSSLMSITFRGGLLPVKRIVPEIDPAVSESTRYAGCTTAFSAWSAGGEVSLPSFEQPITITNKHEQATYSR